MSNQNQTSRFLPHKSQLYPGDRLRDFQPPSVIEKVVSGRQFFWSQHIIGIIALQLLILKFYNDTIGYAAIVYQQNPATPGIRREIAERNDLR